MIKKKVVPSLRFKGFDDEWVEKEFNEITDKNEGIRRGPFGSAIKKEYFVKSSDYVVYEQQNAIYDNYFTRYNITKEKYHELNRFNLRENDFIMSGAGTIGKISKVPKNIKKGIFNQALIRIRVNNQITDFNFFLQWMRSEKMQQKLTEANPASAMQNLVPMSEVKMWRNYFPQKPEQTQIGEFFKNIDQLISVNQKKYDKLINIKKALLERMFPQQGETVPKLRFDGFSDEWVEKQLRDISEFLDYGLNVASTKYDSINKYIRITDIDEKLRNFNYENITSPNTDLEFAGNYKLYLGDILFARTGASVGKTYQYKSVDGNVYFAGFLIRLRCKSDVNSEFVFQNTLTYNYVRFVRLASQRSGQPGVNAQEYGQFRVDIPSLTEQTKIGKLFKQVDSLINLQQQKLNKLKNIKQACLEKMFV